LLAAACIVLYVTVTPGRRTLERSVGYGLIAIAVLIRGIDLFRAFDYIKVMTDSGPGTATETLTSYAGRIYFGSADFPYASAVALLALVIVIVTSTLFMRIFKVKL
jgi:multiple sugar transport system permease protein